MAEPKAKSNMDPVFEKMLRRFMQHSADEYSARSTGQQVRWCRPPGWNGDPHDLAGMAEAFSRQHSNDDFLEATKDQEASGVTGDIVLTTTVIDYMSCAERAFRMRFLSRTRATAHMLGRKKQHGEQTGTFIQNGVEYARAILAGASAEQDG